MISVFKLFSTHQGKYVYDRETNSILRITAEEYDAFKRIESLNSHEGDEAILYSYRSKGYFSESQLENIEHPQDDLLEFHLSKRVEKITMQVTQDCNLRCSYCSYTGGYDQRTHSKKTMPLETMFKTVDFIMQNSTDVKSIDIGFYGGEPLLEIDKIKETVCYIKENYPHKTVTHSLTTNGTIFTDKIIEFLFERGFNVLVSLDGPKELHDMNRVFADGSGSFETVMKNLKYIKHNFPAFFSKISFNTVVAPEHDFKCVSDYFSASDVIEDNMLTIGLINLFNSHKPIQYNDMYFVHYQLQRTKMLLAALGYINKEEVSKFLAVEIPILSRLYDSLGKQKNFPKTAHPGGPCIPGAMRPFVDIEGNIFPCERVSESSKCMRIGNVFTGYDVTNARALLNIALLTEDECKSCWNFIHCSLCCGSADDTGELSKSTRLSYCTSAKDSTLGKFLTICLLRENGYVFEESDFNVM